MINRVKISYDDNLIKEIDHDGEFLLPTKGKLMSGDVTVITSESSQSEFVKFIDYDGTVLHEYSKLDFLALESLPSNPSHEGLTAQGWNWSLSDAKTYVQEHNVLTIGQSYITDDGKTRLYITLQDDILHPYVGFGIKGTATIDWGDGSTSTVTGYSANTIIFTDHEYAQSGDYLITIDGNIKIIPSADISGTSCCKLFSGSNTTSLNNIDYAYWTYINKVELGNISNDSLIVFFNCYSLESITIPNNITSISNQAFSNCTIIKSVTIPNGVTIIGEYAFNACYSLVSVAIPNGITTINTYAFCYCYVLEAISIPDTVTSIGIGAFQSCSTIVSINIPNGVTSISNYTFGSCYSLKSVIIPNGVTSIEGSAFSGCCSLKSVTIPEGVTYISNFAFSSCYSLISINIPNGVTEIGNKTFNKCFALKSINIPNTVTSIGTTIFEYCKSLSSITIPSGVTSIGMDTFSNCYSLNSVTIPDTVTSIGSSAFYYCYALGSIIIPSSVTSIGSSAFYNCTNLKEIHFTRATPPTIYNANAWTNLPTDCKIYVPTGTLSAYTSASNYPSSSIYTYVEE